jgi:hypothetical protein
MPPELRVTRINLNDRTVEGLEHRTLPVFSVQYHPEASPGPHDAHPLFKRFLKSMPPESKPEDARRARDEALAAIPVRRPGALEPGDADDTSSARGREGGRAAGPAHGARDAKEKE